VASTVQRSPHVALLVNAVAVWHGVIAVAVVLGHDEKRALIRYRSSLGIEIELVDGLERAVGPVHLLVALVPCSAVGDRDVAERAVEATIGVQAEQRALGTPI